MVNRVWIKQFRNINEQLFDIEGQHLFVFGENNQGKTNFLEAIYFLGNGVTLSETGPESVNRVWV